MSVLETVISARNLPVRIIDQSSEAGSASRTAIVQVSLCQKPRFVSGILPLVLLLGAVTETRATPLVPDAELSQTVRIEYRDPAFNPYDLVAVPFNPTLGMLDQVLLVVSGTVKPEVRFSSIVTGRVELTSQLFASGTGRSPGINAVQVVTAMLDGGGNSSAVGLAVPLNGIIDFENLSEFAGSSTTPVAVGLYGFGESARPYGIDVDHSTFVGSGTLIYRYSVPEPPTALLLAATLLGFFGWRPPSSARRRGATGP